MSIIEPKKYHAKIVDYYLAESSTGNAQVIIKFEFQTDNGEGQQLNWYGSFKEGRAREITLDTLLKCGFIGEDISKLAEGPESKTLDLIEELEIEVVKEEYEGRPRLRIKWVNKIPQKNKKLTKEEAFAKLKDINFKDELKVIRNRNN